MNSGQASMMIADTPMPSSFNKSKHGWHADILVTYGTRPSSWPKIHSFEGRKHVFDDDEGQLFFPRRQMWITLVHGLLLRLLIHLIEFNDDDLMMIKIEFKIERRTLIASNYITNMVNQLT